MREVLQGLARVAAEEFVEVERVEKSGPSQFPAYQAQPAQGAGNSKHQILNPKPSGRVMSCEKKEANDGRQLTAYGQQPTDFRF